MGEDFAPDLLSRTVLDPRQNQPAAPVLVNKDLLAAAEERVRSDNVACFLRLAGFDAIVPGQQDFYYGPERLRQLAHFLAEPATRPYRPVHMLAANLIVSSVVRQQNPRLAPGELRLPLRLALDGSSPLHFQLPATIYPWFRQPALEGRASGMTAYDCLADSADPQNFSLPSETGNHCRKLPPDLALPPLQPGSNHALCVTYSDSTGDRTHCQLFSVQHPFLAAAHPYWTPPDPLTPVVFGVLDPSLAGQIGQLSDVWMNVDRRFDTSVQVTDPLEALRQALTACRADPACAGRRKILLAQMPNYKASQLAAKLSGFDLVVGQPDDEHSTGNQSITESDPNPIPYLLTPAATFRAAGLTTNLRRADYFAAGVEGSPRRIDNAVAPLSTAAYPRETPCRTCALTAAVARSTGQSDPRKAYESLALRSMQQFCGADVAFLQHRDIFTGFEAAVALWPPGFHPTAQNLLDEVLWKGDFAFCLPLRGSTLKKVLDRSAAFDKQDRDDLSIDTEKGRGLSILGLQIDPASDAPLIRGQAIDDSKLYGVALTDYLAFGNTGYPEFSSEAIQPLVRVVTLKGLNRLTGLACLQLPETVTRDSCSADEIPAADYFAAIAQQPFDTSRGVTAWLEFKRWAGHPLAPQPDVATLLDKPARSLELQTESRPLWWFTLQNLSLGYNLNFIRGSDKEVPGNFVGNNSFSQLSTPESSQFSLWVRGRGGYSFSRYIDFYSSAEVKYSRLAVRTSIGNGDFGEYQVTLGTNLLRGEVGINSKPLTRRIPVRLLLSEDLLTQVATPFQQIAAPLACGLFPCSNGVTTLTRFTQPKSYLVVTRLGARIQNEHSWFEAGREYGQNIDLPVSYSLVDLASPVPLECAVSRGVTLSNCVSDDPFFTAQTRFVPRLRTQQVAGWFANFHTAIPLWRHQVQLTLDSYGEAFDKQSDDTAYNTRFYEDLTVALNLPVWGNLSFAPQVETFFYASKVVPNAGLLTTHYVFVTTSVTLQYAFDWHRGVGIWRALRYPNGVSTSSSETTPRP